MTNLSLLYKFSQSRGLKPPVTYVDFGQVIGSISGTGGTFKPDSYSVPRKYNIQDLTSLTLG